MRWRLCTALAIAALVAGVAVQSAQGRPDEMKDGMKTVPVRMRIDEEALARLDPFELVEPVFWTVNLYGGPEAYEESLAPFSRPQRLIHAIQRYWAEVDNGGHGQFYDNSTGIVWQDALAGFELLGLDELAANLRESAERLGGSPPLDRQERQALLRRLNPDFGDLDMRFWELEKKHRLADVILAYARSHPKDFLFDGVVQKPAPQGFTTQLFFRAPSKP